MCPHTITLKTRIKKTRNKRTRMPPKILTFLCWVVTKKAFREESSGAPVGVKRVEAER